MLIKYSALEAHLRQTISPLYLLIGSDQFLLNAASVSIKQAWKNKSPDTDLNYLSIQQASDWQTLKDEANHLALFSNAMVVQAHYDKKTLDAAGKNTLIQYAKDNNPRTLVLIIAPELTSKSVQALSNCSELTIVQMTSLSQSAMIQWISTELKRINLMFSPNLVETIYQYTTGNHLACAQVIEKLALMHAPGSQLTIEDILIHLSDQCEYQLYELADACLLGNSTKSIHLIRTAAAQKIEVTLIAWLLTQEIRLLIQFQHQINQGILTPTQIAAQLKIWPQKISLYQNTLKRHSKKSLHRLLRLCQEIDEGFKTGVNKNIWNSIEQVALQLSGNELNITA